MRTIATIPAVAFLIAACSTGWESFPAEAEQRCSKWANAEREEVERTVEQTQSTLDHYRGRWDKAAIQNAEELIVLERHQAPAPDETFLPACVAAVVVASEPCRKEFKGGTDSAIKCVDERAQAGILEAHKATRIRAPGRTN